MRHAWLACLLLGTTAVAQTTAPARSPVGAEHSPIVTWQPYPGGEPPTRRRLTPADIQRQRSLAEALYKAVQGTPFATPTELATLGTGWASVEPTGAMSLSFITYWSQPRDVTRRADGALVPKLGGAHTLLYFATNDPPNAASLAERDTQDLHRNVEDGGPGGYFPFPKVYGQLAGGRVYADYVLITPDGTPALEGAPLGALLEAEIAHMREALGRTDRSARLTQLEAESTPEANAERRSKRAASWARQYPDPAVLQARLDAEARSDEAYYVKEKAASTPPAADAPAAQDPANWYWGPRKALKALEDQLAALDPASRTRPACARLDKAFPAGFQVRVAAMTGSVAPAGCTPMARVRPNLVDPARPSGDVQLLTIWFRESACGTRWDAAVPPGNAPFGNKCQAAVPMLKAMDWPAVRAAFGWK